MQFTDFLDLSLHCFVFMSSSVTDLYRVACALTVLMIYPALSCEAEVKRLALRP